MYAVSDEIIRMVLLFILFHGSSVTSLICLLYIMFAVEFIDINLYVLVLTIFVAECKFVGSGIVGRGFQSRRGQINDLRFFKHIKIENKLL